MTQDKENNRFHLQRKGVKHTCPSCGRYKCFRRYIDEETGKELADDCGICDHLNSCGYHKPPRELFREQPELRPSVGDDHAVINGSVSVLSRPAPTYPAPEEYVQTEFFDHSWTEKASARNCPFKEWFRSLPFDSELIEQTLADYYVGASRKYIIVDGVNYGTAVMFWQIDEQQRVHDAKLMAYKLDGHRVPGWGNSMRSMCEKKKIGPQLEQTEKVLFGVHLLDKYPDKPVAIVESEKTALVCTCKRPDLLWLATGGCGNLQVSKLRALKGRIVIVFPDSGVFDKWFELMRESGLMNYSVSNFLEQYEPNTDIADVILGEAKLKNVEPSNTVGNGNQ